MQGGEDGVVVQVVGEALALDEEWVLGGVLRAKLEGGFPGGGVGFDRLGSEVGGLRHRARLADGLAVQLVALLDLGLDRLGQYALAALIAAADEIDGIATSTARDKPDVIS